MKKTLIAVAALSAALVARAGDGGAAQKQGETPAVSIELVSPTNGEVVALVPDAQKKAMAPQTLAERLKLFADDKAGSKVLRHDGYWRRARPLRLKWSVPAPGKWGAKVEIARKPDFSDARKWYVRAAEVDDVSGREKEGGANGGVNAYTVPYANLEVARRYFWRVSVRGRCKRFNCGPKCNCTESKSVVNSQVAMFETEDLAPRWIEIEGRVRNFRDLGGWRTQDGRRVKQGMVFRSAGLNDNSATGEAHGRNRLTVEDLKYLTGTLGIRSDLDLRSKGETADLAESPLGAGVAFVQNSSTCYDGIFREDGKKKMAINFRHFCDRRNYPVIMHCIGGADRTGSLAYVLNGVLGVSRHDIEVDWESTFYPRIPDRNPDPHFWCRESHFNDGFSKYGKEGDSWNRRIELYLLDCGVTEAEIATFRDIMIEPADVK
ncbi:MAG: tyrosine-protein phosphatase [Kiritimatiellae bacterium]|nr:tyrosine-protein phosphatase [Kiritimatiellia bacterium]